MNYLKSCPNCTYPHSGPWVRCFMCGHNLILSKMAELASDLVDELKADNDRSDWRLSPRKEYYDEMDRKWDTDE